MLQSAVFLLLESAINKLLQSDQITARSLVKLSGKSIAIELTDFPLHFIIVPYEGGLQLLHKSNTLPDTTLKGKLQDFISLLQQDDKSSQFFGNGISILGDTHIANTLQRLIANSSIDWPAFISRYTGDIAAHHLTNTLSKTTRHLSSTKNSLQLNLAEYLQEETDTLPARAEVDGFISDIDQLNQRTERLNAKLNMIEADCKA